MIRGWWTSCLVVLAAVSASVAQPSSTNSISLQAKLAGVPNGTVTLTVRFYDAETGGNQIGTPIVAPNVAVENGIVSVPLDLGTQAATLFNGQTRWMGIRVGAAASDLSPRTLVTSVPYAVAARTLDSRGTAVATPEGTGSPAFAVATYSSSGATPAVFPDWDGTGHAAVAHFGLGAPWTGAHGIWFSSAQNTPYPGTNISSVLVTINSGPSNFFEVRRMAEGGSIVAGSTLFDVRSNGVTDVIGTLNVVGHTYTRVLTITGADIAEPFNVAKDDKSVRPMPGMVMSIDAANPGKLRLSTEAYDKKVAGAISGANGLSVGVVMGGDNADPMIKGEYPVAMSGRVYVWCDASFGAIAPGDRLTTSATPGHAMRVGDEAKAPGTVIGKAMTELKEGKGLVLVLVNLQ